METLAYLQLVLACESPAFERLSGEKQKSTANVWIGFFSLMLMFEALIGHPALALLRVGSRGNEVVELQSRLISAGYLFGTATGNYDEVTQTAVENFQRSRGLAVDGVAGPNTLAALQRFPAAFPIDRPEPSPTAQTPAPSEQGSQPPEQGSQASSPSSQTLRQGDEGADVTALQRQLTTARYYAGPVTGYFGALTQTAVEKLQAAQGLTVDGIYGPATRASLQRLLAQPQLGCRCPEGGNLAIATPNAPPATRPPVASTPVRRPPPTGVPQNVTPAYYRSSPVYAYYPRTLRKGQSGSAIADLQRRLGLAGYPTPITGRFDDPTQRSVMRFQLAKGILADGVAGPSTLSALGIPGLLRVVRGSAAEAAVARASYQPTQLANRSALPHRSSSRLSVLDLQRRLAARGFNPGPLDGVWGPRTQAAVARAQQFYRIRREDVLRGNFR